MNGRFSKTIGIATLVAGLVVPGMMAAASVREGSITEPETIVLSLGEGDSAVRATAAYDLTSPDWRRGGLSMMRAIVTDQAGGQVGSIVWNCIRSKVAWLCDLYLSLEEGPSVHGGQVIVSGPFRGFNGESLAIIGGTEAYANARGQATLTVEGDAFLITLDLLP